MSKFVSSRDVPNAMAEAVALWAHKRGCTTFDGTPCASFKGSHRAGDVTWASIHLADVCNALHITLADLAALETTS